MAIKIFIDQGHNIGNVNAGASGNGVVEAEVTYWVGIYLAALLFADSNFDVRVSRRTLDLSLIHIWDKASCRFWYLCI